MTDHRVIPRLRVGLGFRSLSTSVPSMAPHGHQGRDVHDRKRPVALLPREMKSASCGCSALTHFEESRFRSRIRSAIATWFTRLVKRLRRLCECWDIVTQGALRDPGLCCTTPSAQNIGENRRQRLRHR